MLIIYTNGHAMFVRESGDERDCQYSGDFAFLLTRDCPTAASSSTKLKRTLGGSLALHCKKHTSGNEHWFKLDTYSIDKFTWLTDRKQDAKTSDVGGRDINDEKGKRGHDNIDQGGFL